MAKEDYLVITTITKGVKETNRVCVYRGKDFKRGEDAYYNYAKKVRSICVRTNENLDLSVMNISGHKSDGTRMDVYFGKISQMRNI